MARKSIPVEEKIARQKEVVSRAKDRYDEALVDLEALMRKRDEIRKKELIEAYIASGRSFEGVMEFLTTKEGDE